jgi:hypothetical protein
MLSKPCTQCRQENTLVTRGSSSEELNMRNTFERMDHDLLCEVQDIFISNSNLQIKEEEHPKLVVSLLSVNSSGASPVATSGHTYRGEDSPLRVTSSHLVKPIHYSFRTNQNFPMFLRCFISFFMEQAVLRFALRVGGISLIT